MNEGLTFDDVLLTPQYSDVLPAEVNLKTKLTKSIELNIPLISAAMDTVTEADMAIVMAKVGGIGVIHRAMSPSAQVLEARKVKEYKNFSKDLATLDNKGCLAVTAAIGVSKDSKERSEKLINAGVDALVVDTAHSHSKMVLERVSELKKDFPKTELIVGNVATFEAGQDLIARGADAIKVGVGPGSICTTRIISGVGVPQITAIQEVYRAAKQAGIPVIADGGIKFSGDIVKALASGASSIMIGGLFAGTDEAPGEIFEDGDQKFKSYRGMGSLGVIQSNGGDRYFQKNTKDASKIIPEGVEAKVPHRGSIKDIIHQLLGGTRSGMGYCGAKIIKDLHEKAKFIKITKAGLIESHPHDVTLVKRPLNYRV